MPFVSSKRIANMEKLLLDLHERLDGLSKPAGADRARSGAPAESRIEIAIQTLHVQEVKLEELAFRLDNIAIDDLSGSFNLGNNFMGKLDPAGSANAKAKSSGQAGPTLADRAASANNLSTGEAFQKKPRPELPGLTKSDKGFRMTYGQPGRAKPDA